jgi:hypothetical protein
MDLILGHNQFIGISHISEKKSREREKKFSNIKNIYNVVEKAADLGYKSMIIETHPRMLNFLEYYKKNKNFDIDFYLQVPYVQGYIQKMNEKGLFGLVTDIIQRGGIKTTSVMALKNIVHLAQKNYSSIATSTLQLEVAPFMDVKIKGLLLHNVMTDLLLSLHIPDIFIEYIRYVKDELRLKPGFITLNFHLFKNNLKKWDINPPLVMTPINPKGYDMNPSKEDVEAGINEYGGEIIAMNILGGGAFSPNNSYSYLQSFKGIKYCVIGASSENHLRELIKIFKG